MASDEDVKEGKFVIHFLFSSKLHSRVDATEALVEVVGWVGAAVVAWAETWANILACRDGAINIVHICK